MDLYRREEMLEILYPVGVLGGLGLLFGVGLSMASKVFSRGSRS